MGIFGEVTFVYLLLYAGECDFVWLGLVLEGPLPRGWPLLWATGRAGQAWRVGPWVDLRLPSSSFSA